MICPQCNQDKPVTDFPIRARKYPWCHTCRYAQKLGYARAVNKRYTERVKADPVLLEVARASRRAYAKRYRDKAGDHHRAYQREYHRRYDPTYRRTPTGK